MSATSCCCCCCCRFARLQLYTISLFSTMSLVADAELRVPGLMSRQFPFSRVREEDVNIGLALSVHQSADNDDRCGILIPSYVLWSWAMQFAVEQINARNDLLPNVTLGFVQMDDCYNALKALEVCMYFVKDSSLGNCSIDPIYSSYDVVGVIGFSFSDESVTVSPYLGTFKLPHMGVYSTANTLSDKVKYPFFMRLVPPESNQQQTLLQVMRLLNWTYVSLAHSPDAYGDGAAADIQDLLRLNRDICLAVTARIPPAAADSDYDYVVDKLAADQQARVVLSYISFSDTQGFFNAVRRRVGVGWFVFLGGDTLGSKENENFADILEGSIHTDLPSAPMNDLQQYIWSLTYGQHVDTSLHKVTDAADERESFSADFNGLRHDDHAIYDDTTAGSREDNNRIDAGRRPRRRRSRNYSMLLIAVVTLLLTSCCSVLNVY